MKKTVIVALALLSLQSAFADGGRDPGRDPGRRDPAPAPRDPGPAPRDPGPAPRDPGRDRIDFPMCLKQLDAAERTISDLRRDMRDAEKRCEERGHNDRENEDLRIENRRLNDTITNLTIDNGRLLDENRDLRRQIEDLRGERNGRTLGSFSYAGCQDFKGKIDLKYIVSAEGRMPLESETLAKQKVASAYSCSYGIVIGKTEEIRFTQANNYCVAGCQDFTGKVDQKYIQTGTGRNVTEAEYNALKAVTAKFNCAYGIQVQACQ